MTIDGTDISTFGLKIEKLNNYFSVPARKKTTTIPGFQAKDIVMQQREIFLQLFGKYESLALLKSNTDNFKTLLNSLFIHVIIYPERNVNFNFTITEGVKIDPDIMNKSVVITFNANIVE